MINESLALKVNVKMKLLRLYSCLSNVYSSDSICDSCGRSHDLTPIFAEVSIFESIFSTVQRFYDHEFMSSFSYACNRSSWYESRFLLNGTV